MMIIMAKMSMTKIKALKEIYTNQINKKYHILQDALNTQEEELKEQILDDYIATMRTDADVKFELGYNYVWIDSNGAVEIRQDCITRKTGMVSERGSEIKSEMAKLCRAKKQRLMELDMWEIEALKAPTVEDVPEFDVEIYPSPYECV